MRIADRAVVVPPRPPAGEQASGAPPETPERDPRGAAPARSGRDLDPFGREIWRRLRARRAWHVVLDVGADDGELLPTEDPRWSGATTATASRAAPGAAPRRVGCVRLDEFLLAHAVRAGSSVLVKVDVGGGEREVLDGLLPALPLLGEILVQVDVAHAADGDLAWMADRFVLHLVDTATCTPVPAASVADARRLLAGGRCHRQDAVLARDPLAGPL